MTNDYQYPDESQRRRDDRHARKARELVRDGQYRAAMDEAGMISHYDRQSDVIDEVRRRGE